MRRRVVAMLGRKRALLLDLDGTVLDSHGLIYQCLDETARRHLGVAFPRALWEQHIGIPLADLLSLIQPSDPGAGPPLEVLISSYRETQERYEHRLRPFPGIESVLATLQTQGIRLAIVTTKLQAVARRQLTAIGLVASFNTIIGFDDCTRAKPDAEPFQRALRALGVQPEEAAGVGDGPVDVQGSRAAGIMAVGALWGTVNPSALLAAGPDRTIAVPAELLELDG